MTPANLFLVVILIFLPLFTAVPCPPGTFARNRSAPCRPCPRGTYQFLVTLIPSRCIKCPPGTYLPFRRGRGKDICMRCPANTFSVIRGATSVSSCQPCPAALVSAPGSTKCTKPCNVCQILRIDGCKTCSDGQKPVNDLCVVGTFTDSVCVDGKPKRCGPGFSPFASVGFGGCDQCSTGISPVGRKCSDCPLGLVRNAKRTRCRPCSAGQALREFSNPASCTDCPSGQNANGSRPVCVPDGTPCPSNFFEDSSGNCNTCAPGERFNPRRTQCVKCAEDETSPGGLSRRCKKCRKNEIGGATCECRPGFIRNTRNVCAPCPAGTIQTFRGCQDCPIGSFSEAGSTECKPCPPETANPEPSQGLCKKCKKGLIASTLRGSEYPSVRRAQFPEFEFGSFNPEEVSRSDCVDVRTNCPPDRRRVTDGEGNFYCEPTSCPPNNFMTFVRPRGNFRGRLRACISCPPGLILVENQCRLCKRNQISEGGTTEDCVDCPPLEKRRDGKCVCGAFTRGLQFRNPNGVCQECPAGTGTFTLQEIFRCPRCPRGTVNAEAGSLFCNPCESGTVERDRLRCEKCPDGFMSFGVQDTRCVKIGGDNGSSAS